MLVARPDLWSTIVVRCAHSLVVEALDGTDATDALLAWGRASGSTTVASVEITLRHSAEGTITASRILRSLLGGLPLAARASAVRTLARSAVATRPTTEREAALSVLDRWTA